ncbi:MAG: hypothetical protein ABR568_13710 [Pyrinomonadaceae bacterium]
MSHPEPRALAYRFFVAIAVVLFAAGSSYPQGAGSVSGRWVWKEPARKNKPQIQFTLTINRKGDVVRGVYSVDEFINRKWQGEDGNQTPFQGRVKGNTLQIEFDPVATVPGYQENVTYSAPTDGRRPSTAVLTSSGKTLLWRMSRGTGIEGVPTQFALRRERRR